MALNSSDPMCFEIVTTSYDRDFERCRLLCETVDRFVQGDWRHRLVIDRVDEALFRPLTSARREIVVKEDILPWWIRPTPLTFGRFGRRVWLSLRSRPMGGWLMQQVAKMEIAARATAEVVLLVDSDVCFVRPFTVDRVIEDGRAMLYRVPGAIRKDSGPHAEWCERAARLLGVDLRFPQPDFISQMITWRADAVRQLCRRIEENTGRSWIAAMADARRVSEYLTYGLFVEHVLGIEAAGHFDTDRPLCHSWWEYRALDPAAIRSFIARAAADQVAIGVQSISGTPIELIRAGVQTAV